MSDRTYDGDTQTETLYIYLIITALSQRYYH